MNLEKVLELKNRIHHLQKSILARDEGLQMDYGNSEKWKELMNTHDREEMDLLQKELERLLNDPRAGEVNDEPLQWLGQTTDLVFWMGFLHDNGWLQAEDDENFFRLVAMHFVGTNKKTGAPEPLDGHSLRVNFDSLKFNRRKKKKSLFECVREIKLKVQQRPNKGKNDMKD